MIIDVRPATVSELALVRDSWSRHMRPRFRDASPMGAGLRGHPWGAGAYVGQSTATEMVRALVDLHATTDDVLVASFQPEEGPAEAVGWIARSAQATRSGALHVVHFAFVLREARRVGIASRLLQHVRAEANRVGAKVIPATMNSRGLRLWESEQSQ